MRYGWITVTILLLFTVIVVRAQDDSCPEIVEIALASVNDVCGNVSRNSACYGYNQVSATFNSEVPPEFFTQVSDVAPLLDLETLQTAELNTELDIWGLAVMNVQANLPETLPGQSVVILLMGDAEIRNEVDPATAFVSGEAITVTTVAPASNIRTLPSTTASVPASVPAGTEFQTDGQSADGEWIRIVYDNRPGWISKSLVAFDEALNNLPVIQSGQFTPMQAFTFSTGIGQPVCSRAPDSIMIQGPEDIDVTINANGADITIGSTIVLKTPEDNRMQVISVSGSAIVEGLPVPAGFTVSTELDGNGTAIPGTLTGFRAVSDAELAELEVLEDVTADFMNYSVTLPSRIEIIRLQTAIQNRETAIEDCRSEDLSPQECLDIIGSDGSLANRMQRCTNRGLSVEVCRAIIGGNIDASTVLRCLSEGYTTEEACREATQAQAETTLQSFCSAGGAVTQEECQTFCESQGYSTLEACQTAAVNLAQSGSIDDLLALCQSFGATTVEECRSLCESRGYTSIEDCYNAATQASSGGQAPAPAPRPTLTQEEKIVAFCQSIGASTAQECGQICQSNGYSTVQECYAGMGGGN